MSTSDPFRRAARADAERRRSSAQREFNRLQRQARRDLRTVRRRGETAAIVARSRLAELGVRALGKLTSALRRQRREPHGRRRSSP